MDFNQSTLFISLRSPFARRVRLAFQEHGINFKEEVLDVLKPNPEYLAINPIGRVPSLRLKSGDVLIDSNLILQAFYESKRDSGLLPKTDADKLTAYRWSGVAVGLCDKLVEYFLDSLRPKQCHDQDVLNELKLALEVSLKEFDKYISGRQFILNHLSQADLDMGTAFGYLKLRYSKDVLKEYSQIEKYLASLEARSSFASTAPPPPQS